MKNLTRIISITIMLIIICSLLLASCGRSGALRNLRYDPVGTYNVDEKLKGTELNVFNWGEYISDGSEGSLDVNKAFEELTGIHVNYSNYESNEAMYAKLKPGAVNYDIVIPSDYMIERMIKEDMLAELDFDMIDNYRFIDEKYKDLYFDEDNKYSVPYNVGMFGLIYNTTMVDGEPDSWEIMWDEKYKDQILTFNNPRDSFAIAQLILGIDLNTTNPDEWRAAADKLKEQNSVLQGRVMDEIFNKMQGGNAAIAAYYAGDYLLMADINEDLAFVYPKEGTNIFVDSICVPKNAQNYDAAMLYINFLLEPEVALANAEYLCYASPNTSVLENPDYSLKDNEIIYPKEEDMPFCQYYHDMDPETRALYNSLWEEVVNDK